MLDMRQRRKDKHYGKWREEESEWATERRKSKARPDQLISLLLPIFCWMVECIWWNGDIDIAPYSSSPFSSPFQQNKWEKGARQGEQNTRELPTKQLAQTIKIKSSEIMYCCRCCCCWFGSVGSAVPLPQYCQKGRRKKGTNFTLLRKMASVSDSDDDGDDDDAKRFFSISKFSFFLRCWTCDRFRFLVPFYIICGQFSFVLFCSNFLGKNIYLFMKSLFSQLEKSWWWWWRCHTKNGNLFLERKFELRNLICLREAGQNLTEVQEHIKDTLFI